MKINKYLSKSISIFRIFSISVIFVYCGPYSVCWYRTWHRISNLQRPLSSRFILLLLPAQPCLCTVSHKYQVQIAVGSPEKSISIAGRQLDGSVISRPMDMNIHENKVRGILRSPQCHVKCFGHVGKQTVTSRYQPGVGLSPTDKMLISIKDMLIRIITFQNYP